MFVHCRALESLTELARLVNEVDPEEEAQVPWQLLSSACVSKCCQLLCVEVRGKLVLTLLGAGRSHCFGLMHL